MNKLSNRSTIAAVIAACVIFVPLSACTQVIDKPGVAEPTSIGNKIDDTVVTAKVKSALLGDDYVKSLDVKVVTRKGVVMLSGFADNQAQIDRSILVTKSVPGVNTVDNKMSLKEGIQSVGNKIDDTVITAGVKSAMLQDPMMKSMEVSVSTRKGEVQLSGFVDSSLQLNHAVDVAKRVDGVSSVVNNMTVKK
jgi:hyperosmotically inducible protein